MEKANVDMDKCPKLTPVLLRVNTGEDFEPMWVAGIRDGDGNYRPCYVDPIAPGDVLAWAPLDVED